MDIRNYIDSTYLKTPQQSGLTEEETLKKVQELIQEAISERLYAVMIRPCYVKTAKEIITQNQSSVKVGTVIGFHEGTYSVPQKLEEAQKAIEDGADELDFVINYEIFKKGIVEMLKMEFIRCTELCMKHQVVAKWIIETAALTNEQIAAITKNIEKWANISFHVNLDKIFVKTSTGFFTTPNGEPNGATFENIKIILENAGELPVKAAGGVKTKEDAEKMIALGVKRIGTSSAKNLL